MKWIIANIAAAKSFGVLDAMRQRGAGPNVYGPAWRDLRAASFAATISQKVV